MSTLLERQKEFTGYLVVGFPELGLKGLPLKSAAAVTGNATQENLVRPVTIGPLDNGSNGALQWRLDRLDGPTGLRGWAKANGMTWDSLRTQAAFFLYELERDYPQLTLDLRNGTKSIETLTANISRFYERPNKKYEHLDKRIAAARNTFAAMSKEPVPIPPPPPPLPEVIQPIAASPNTSTIGWLFFAYSAACAFRITIFGLPSEGDPIFVFLIGLALQYLPDAPAKATAAAPNLPAKDNPMSAQLDAFKAVVNDLVTVIDAVVTSHESLKLQANEGAAVDAELATITDQFRAAVDKLNALTH